MVRLVFPHKSKVDLKIDPSSALVIDLDDSCWLCVRLCLHNPNVLVIALFTFILARYLRLFGLIISTLLISFLSRDAYLRLELRTLVI